MTSIPEAALPPQKLSILLLEDNVLDAELTCASLGFEEGNCDTTRVESAADFERAVRSCRYDVILADYSLPSFDGISALRIAQQHCPETPFIFVSGALGEELAIETLKQGATDYVLKHRLDRLRPAVLRALRERDARAEKQRAEERLRELAEENARLYEESIKANVAKDEFIAMISHELRTPMTAILGWTRMLKLGDLSPDDFQAALNAVERSATVQAQLIEDLLDLSRIATGKLTLQYESVDLSDVVNAAADAIRVAADQKQIEIVREMPDHPLLVRGDRNRLQQVVVNLLQNAVKFTPEGGHVRIRCAPRSGAVRLSVTDDGIGIRPEFLHHLFEPFRQDESSSNARIGLGLGLSIVRHIVERHGGAVTARSEGEGRGATFEVTLPLLAASTRAAEADDSPLTMPDLTDVRVLLVEDDAEARALITMITSRCNAIVRAAASVDEALEILPTMQWDVIISDIAMPGRTGYALIAEIQRLMGADAPPVIALTAFGSPEDRRRIETAGFVRHMIKPVDPFIFAQTIETVLKSAVSR